MTDDIVARLRNEREALRAGLSTIVHCQSRLTRKEMREAAALVLEKAELKPKWFGGDQSPFIRIALEAEARVRELEAALAATESERRTAVEEMQRYRARLSTIEAGTIERCAKAAMSSMTSKNLADRSPAHIAAAIHQLAKEVKP